MSLTRRGLLAGLASLGPATAGSLAPIAAAAAPGPQAEARAPLFDGMGDYRVPDASASAIVRRYVAQGMVLAWGFNPQESARSFDGARRIAPDCAAAHWGLAWALGPTLNADMEPADAARVADAVAQARRWRAQASPRFRGLIDALVLRHPAPDALDEEAYADRMQRLAAASPGDADLAVLAAESQLALHPYDWWDEDGRALPWTGGIVALLERALRVAPAHPGANHYWVHLFETSATPARARLQAERLRTLVPGSGHLLHMPAHIDMRTGRYDLAVAASERSIDADRRYLAQVDAQGAYRVGYVAHNHHFLWAAAAMAGRSRLALEAAQAAWPAACGPRPGDLRSGVLQHYAVLPLHALVRFGRWSEILTGTRPPDGDAPYPLAMWHYARGTAWARSGEPALAQAAAAELERVAADPRLQSTRVKNINPAAALVRIARLTLQADLLAAGGRHAAAVAPLAEAVWTEDALATDEPHLWLAPTRHALGAALLDAGRAVQAEQVYRADLHHYPDNGWSLTGLATALQARGRRDEAAWVATQRDRAWRDADLRPARSRL